VLKLPAPTVN